MNNEQKPPEYFNVLANRVMTPGERDLHLWHLKEVEHLKREAEKREKEAIRQTMGAVLALVTLVFFPVHFQTTWAFYVMFPAAIAVYLVCVGLK